MNILSRFHPRYPKVLAYMLQASEYSLRDFVAWVQRVQDFSDVEKRKKFIPTAKSIAVLILLWLVAVLWCLVWWLAHPLLLPLGIFSVPFVLPYLILPPLAVLHYIQKPTEAFIVAKATEKLARISATKIAIAGSYGKTSFKENLQTILSAGGEKVKATPGNWNTPLGIARFVRTLAGDEKVLVFEMGEYYPGDIRTLSKMIRPDIGVITGVNEAHLEKFGNVENAAKTIFEIAEFVAPEKLYVNGENILATKYATKENVLYGREGAGSWKVLDAKTNIEGTSFTLVGEDMHTEVTSKLLGLHQVGPLVAASVIASTLGLTEKEIVAGIANTSPFAHRLAPRKEAEGVIFIDDTYNANPDGIEVGLAVLASVEAKRRIYVTPGLVETGGKTQSLHQEIGKKIAQVADVVILIKNSTTPYIAEGLAETKFKGSVLSADTVERAFLMLKSMELPGDVILMQNDWTDNYA